MPQKLSVRNKIFTPMMIELNNVSKTYTNASETFIALRDINLNIDKGDFFSVIGPSGAGKSTLLYLIGGLIHPDSGQVKYNGNDIYSLKARDINRFRREHLGFMFQQFHLIPWLTVTENIKLACYEKNQEGKIEYYLEGCSLTELKNKYPSELSVGEKQRTAFIRAVISQPEILLADEPTGNLDPGNSDILISLVEEFRKNGGTVILVSHNPALTKFASVRIKLDKGRIQK
jgi:ABC-type lipoprotein export system ATPase subunit